jgi:Ankyrin repeats (many copies)/RING-type zinc-finger
MPANDASTDNNNSGGGDDGDGETSYAFGVTGPSRDLWRSARERNRLIARYQIRQRVTLGDNNVCSDESSTDHCYRSNDSILSSALLAVLKGDRSKFSLSFMDRHHPLLSSTIETNKFMELTSNDKDFPNIYDHTLHLVEAWSGKLRRETLRKHFDVIKCFTFCEFASWLGRASIVSALLLGGISPTTRGQYQMHNSIKRAEDEMNINKRKEELSRIGGAVLQRFFDTFPLRLSTYLVTRVMEARWNAHWESNRNPATKNDPNMPSFCCPVCNDNINVPLDLRLLFLPCGHTCCESCTWKDMLDMIDDERRTTLKDIFTCTVCRTACKGMVIDIIEKNSTVVSLPPNLYHQIPQTPFTRKEASIQRFRELPIDQKTLKAQRKHMKKKKPSEASHIARNWRDAVLPSLGTSQDVRAEKFAHYIDQNAVHYVRACLDAGVNVDGTNEYGQTALHVAVWRGFEQIIQILLDYGADTTISDNAGVSVWDVCCINEQSHIMNIISNFSEEQDPTQNDLSYLRQLNIQEDTSPKSFSSTMPSRNHRPQTTVLIPDNLNHDGIGAFVIENSISTNVVDALLNLFYSVPVHQQQKTKKQQALCSERTYYCDSTSTVQQLLQTALWNAGVISKDECKSSLSSSSTSTIFPHMRFLNYKEQGIVLAPHVDLCRSHPFQSTTGSDIDINGGSAKDPHNYPPSAAKNEIIVRSTHTFILYLTDCFEGGATRLLGDITGEGHGKVLATIEPRRGRLLLFPHSTPHEGLEVVDVPKILLRGEARLLSDS